MRTSLMAGALAALFCGLAPSSARAESYADTLSHPTVSHRPDGAIVVTMAAQGQLPGVLTLELQADGSSVTGHWALTVAFTNTTPPPGVEVQDQDGWAELVERGTLKGTVQSGTLMVDASGVVTGVAGLALELTGGTLEFAAVTNGQGAAEGSSLDDPSNATGSLSLGF